MAALMTGPIATYLRKRGDLRRPLEGHVPDQVRRAVVIPVRAESEYLFETLASVAANPAPHVNETLVVCVVNNRQDDELAIAADNQSVLDRLRGGKDIPLPVAWIDAASPGVALAPGEGVGVARKLGMDHAVAVLAAAGAEDGLVHALDADTVVEPAYLGVVQHHFDQYGTWAAVVDFQHRLEGPPAQHTAILQYECYLQYHPLGLAYARSPYAYPAIGSTMVCRARAYAAVAGMNRREAGEDFYFLQQLAKTGGVERIWTTRVQPSSRPSARVPMGTGPRVRAGMARPDAPWRLYAPGSYGALKAWFEAVETAIDADGALLRTVAKNIEPALGEFLDAAKFTAVWDRLRRHAPTPAARLAQFHRWFDGLRSLRLIHHLRGAGYPDVPAPDAVAGLLTCLGAPPAAAGGPARLLAALRTAARRDYTQA